MKRKHTPISLLFLLSVAVTSTPLAAADLPLWAYGYVTAPANPGDYSARCLGTRPADCDRPGGLAKDPANTVRSLEGSDRTFTVAQITARYGPADWFPGDHPATPDIIAHGRQADGLRACANCHLHNGRGLMQNAPVAGLPVDYFLRQIAELADGRRASSDLNKANAFEMAAIARNLTAEEARAAAEYYSAIPFTKAMRVVESTTVPKFTATINGLFLAADGNETEPLGKRLIELPESSYETNMLRNPRAGFVVYAPPGSLARGEALVTRGEQGTTVECLSCHGPDLHGISGNGPPIAGRSPSYLARQLFDLQQGRRNGALAPLMKPTVENLGADDLRAIVAYVASLDP
jgi:cytochrome c553